VANGRAATGGASSELNPFMYTLLNVVAAPLLPSRYDSARAERIMNDSIAQYPKAARLLGFAGGECEKNWRTSLRAWAEDQAEANWLLPTGLMIGQGMLDNGVDNSAALLRFLEARLTSSVGSDALPELDPSLKILVIAGSYRTGTSILQRVIGADSRVITFPQWSLFSPVDAESAVKARNNINIMSTSDPFNGLRFMSSEITDSFTVLHTMEADLAEEESAYWCSAAFGPGLGMINYQQYVQPRSGCCKHGRTSKATSSDLVARRCYFERALPGFVKAWLHGDSVLRRSRVAEGHFNDKLLVLKTPMYGMALPEIKRAFPQAKVVVTHRRVQTQVPAAMTMLLTWMGFFASDKARPRDVGLNVIDHLEVLAREQAANKALIDLNIDHAALKADPMGTALRILTDVLDMDVPESEQQRMRSYLAGDGDYKGSTAPAKDPRCLGVDWAHEYKREGFTQYMEAFYPNGQ